MFKLLHLIIVAILMSCPVSYDLNGQTQNETNTYSLQTELDTLLSWFPGEYDNHEQIYKEFVNDVAEEKRHRQTYHIFHPVSFPFIPGRQIYAEQSQHYNRDDIYRQRIYSFNIDEIEQAIRLTIYTPKAPEKLTGLHLNNSNLEELVESDFILKPGCDVFWKKVGDEFQGYLKDNACSYYSEKFEKRVFLNETLILRKDALLLDDAAVDENGIAVFGVHDKGPTINLKEKSCK